MLRRPEHWPPASSTSRLASLALSISLKASESHQEACIVGARSRRRTKRWAWHLSQQKPWPRAWVQAQQACGAKRKDETWLTWDLSRIPRSAGLRTDFRGANRGTERSGRRLQWPRGEVSGAWTRQGRPGEVVKFLLRAEDSNQQPKA